MHIPIALLSTSNASPLPPQLLKVLLPLTIQIQMDSVKGAFASIGGSIARIAMRPEIPTPIVLEEPQSLIQSRETIFLASTSKPRHLQLVLELVDSPRSQERHESGQQLFREDGVVEDDSAAVPCFGI